MATLRAALSQLDGIRFAVPTERDEPSSSVTYEATSIEAEVVEGSSFRILPVPPLTESGFTHFLDGAQRAWQTFYRRLSPIYLAHTSAAVLERIDGDLSPPEGGNYEGALEAFVPDDPQLCALLSTVVPPVAVKVADTQPGGYEDLVKEAISKRRDQIEHRLAQSFSQGRLLIDGGIGKALRHQGEEPFVVGLVKSHRKQYFRSAARTEQILGMRVGQRSSVFLRPADSLQGESVYSFYLRLHAGENTAPLFGIVRIELPATAAYVQAADEIAGWLLHERAPLSLPDARYDKLLYPIRLVEQHLKARQPSTAAILGLVG